MTFHITHRSRFLNRPLATTVRDLLGNAGSYAVQLQRANVAPGNLCWRMVGIHHLTPDENRGKNAVYVDVVDAAGNVVTTPNLRLQWGWEDQRADEAAPPRVFDKPASEPAANVDLYHGQLLWVHITGDDVPSDKVLNLHTNHPEERGPNGEAWNAQGHHSFYLLFQQVRQEVGDGPDDGDTGGVDTGDEPADGTGVGNGGTDSAFRFERWPTTRQIITQVFGANPQEYARFNLPGHEGVDIAADQGSHIFCVAPGVVKLVHDLAMPTARQDHPYGNHLRIQHAGGYTTTYAHLQTISVLQDQAVVGGQILGLAGDTGNADGSHLHLTLNKLGSQFPGYPPGLIDPMPFLLPLLAATQDDATYVRDIVVDGTAVDGGQPVEQRWTIRNTGHTTWGEGYQLAFESGERFGDSEVLPVPTTAPGAEATLPLPFRAPSAPGSYRSYWRLRNPAGQWFGERLWVDITVKTVVEPIKVVRGNKLGFYLHMSTDQFGLWDAVRRVQPPVLLIHADTSNDLLLNEIRSFRAPDAFVIGRWYIPNDQQRALLEGGDPAGAGRRFAEQIISYDFGKFTKRSATGRLLVDAWMGLNEALPGPASGSYQGDPATYQRLYAAYDQFQVAFRARLVEAGIEAVAFNFAAGNFIEPAHYLDFFPQTLASHTYLGFHEYGWPALIPGAGVHTSAGLYRQVLEGVRAQYGTNHRVIITEAGLTRAYGHPQNPDEGWLNHAEPLDQNRYWESLVWYNQHLAQDDYVVGACLYEVGHHGNWATFRHLGEDNQNQPLNLVDRMVAVREAAAPCSVAGTVARAIASAGISTAATAPATFTIRGNVRLQGAAAANVVIRLSGDLATLGAVRGAVIDAPGVVSWSRTMTGLTGTVRNLWDRAVVGDVAGLTWDEFKHQVTIINPTLVETAGKFVADQRYLLPTATSDTPAILWDRIVSGYGGTLYQAWLDLVQGKVVGLNYAPFRRLAFVYNPTLADQRYLVAEHHYLFPRTLGSNRYYVTTASTNSGWFRLMAVPLGTYTVVAYGPGLTTAATTITVAGDQEIVLDLQALVSPLVIPPPTQRLTVAQSPNQSPNQSPLADGEGRYNELEIVYTQTVVNLRRDPGYVKKPAHHLLGQIPRGAQLQILTGPQMADGLIWWQARAPLDHLKNGESAIGWVAQAAGNGVQLLGATPPALSTDGDPLLKIPDGTSLESAGTDWSEVESATGSSEAGGADNAVIQLATPFVGNWPLTQGWGARPQVYAKITYGKVPLKGHNGLDFGTPVGTELFATAAGKVKWVDCELQGFGNYIIVQHAWGESLYAHLSRIDVATGTTIAVGQRIGLTGNTGFSSAPHLHFGIRRNPYQITDGWGGFVDPTPYLDPQVLQRR